LTKEEFIDEALDLIQEIDDNHNETAFLTGFINEQLLTADFEVPLEELIAVIKEVKPIIYMHMKITSSGEVRKFLNKSDITFDEALERLGREDFSKKE